jgi:hypothetical protein
MAWAAFGGILGNGSVCGGDEVGVMREGEETLFNEYGRSHFIFGGQSGEMKGEGCGDLGCEPSVWHIMESLIREGRGGVGSKDSVEIMPIICEKI